MSYQSDNMAFNNAMDSLSHYGVKGMQWGKRNEETLRKYGLLAGVFKENGKTYDEEEAKKYSTYGIPQKLGMEPIGTSFMTEDPDKTEKLSFSNLGKKVMEEYVRAKFTPLAGKKKTNSLADKIQQRYKDISVSRALKGLTNSGVKGNGLDSILGRYQFIKEYKEPTVKSRKRYGLNSFYID